TFFGCPPVTEAHRGALLCLGCGGRGGCRGLEQIRRWRVVSMGTADRVKGAEAVNASVETHGDEIAAAIVAELAPLLRPGETMPDVALFFRLVGRKMVAVGGELSTADDAHEAELADDPPWRAKRDAAATAVRSALVDLRDGVTTAHGPDAAR